MRAVEGRPARRVACSWAPRSVDQHPAVHVERDAGEITRKLAREEEAAIRHVGHLAQAIERYSLDDLGFHLRRELAAGDVGLDQPGRDRIDADVARAELTRHRLAETQDAGLRGRVVGPAENAAATLR